MHAHAHGHVMGRDVDFDIGNGWLIGLATLVAAVVAIGVVMVVNDGGGTVEAPVPISQPATPSERLLDAQTRLDGLRQAGASPALMAPTMSDVLLADQAVAAQERDTALEIDRMLARAQ